MYRIATIAALAASSMVFSTAAEDTRPPANPNPTGRPRTIVNVEIWGSINEVIVGPRAIGDPFHQVMRIDTALSPGDFDDEFEADGYYAWNTPCERGCGPLIRGPKAFVSTVGGTTYNGLSFDRVTTHDGALAEGGQRNFDAFSLSDEEFGLPKTDNTLDYFIASAEVLSVLNFVDGDWLAQDFDLKRADDPSMSAIGHVSAWFNEQIEAFGYTINRMRVKSLVCRM